MGNLPCRGRNAHRFCLTSAFVRAPNAGASRALGMLALAIWTSVATEFSQPVLAGLSASQVVVVINGGSLRSRTIANHYIALRNIPAKNVVVLDNVPNSETASVAEFRERILGPLLAEIDRRGLGGVIHCVAYSADFPTAIDIQEDLKPQGELPIVFTPMASINSLTYFYRWVINGNPSYIGLEANFYARRPLEACFANPIGDKLRTQWEAIKAMMENKQHAEAVVELEKVFAELPHQYPVAYLAAGQAAMSGDKKKAIQLLSKSIELGWTNGKYLSDDERFVSCRDDAEFQALQLSLDDKVIPYQEAVAFDSREFWSTNGVPKAKEGTGINYLLSTVLAVTRGPGTTTQQAIEGLRRSATADFSQPDGGFYFCLTPDVRTTTREPNFEMAISQLKQLGFEAEVVNGILPSVKLKVLGVCVGSAGFKWAESHSVMLPGALADNLTSLAGSMHTSGDQVKITELLLAGAAGSSGTVTEPYALQAKFPHPMMYVHYAQGASLAEAFYLNVTGPYQLLIIGDPLCQPCANPPLVSTNTKLRKASSGEQLTFHFRDDGPRQAKLARSSWKPALAPAIISASVDASPPQFGVFRENINVKLTGNESRGYHDLRLAAQGVGDLAIRREIAIPIWIGEEGIIRLDAPKKINLRNAKKLNVSVRATGASAVSVWHDYERLETKQAAEATFEIDPNRLGLGPARLFANATIDEESVRSSPVVIEVEP